MKKTAARTLLITVIGVMWFLASPFIFIYALPQFAFYNQWQTNYFGSVSSANAVSVWFAALWAVEIPLFLLGIFWAGDLWGMIKHHL